MVVGLIAASPVFALGHTREATSLLQSMGMPTNHSQENSVRLANKFLQMSDGQNWTKAEKTDMIPLLSSLEASYNDQVDNEHSADQNTWNVEAAKFTACYTVSSAKFIVGGSVYEENQRLQEYKAKFKACSTVDKRFELYKATSACASQEFSFGTGTAHDVELKDALVKLEYGAQLYHAAVPVSTSLPPNGCGEDQVRMEAQMCEGRKAHRWECESESDCVTSINLPATKSSLQGQQVVRRAAKLSFKKVMCEVEHVLGMTVDGEWQETVTSESSCDDLSLDSSDLILDLTDPEAKPHCDDPDIAIYPSTSDLGQCSKWLEQEFGGWTANTVTIPDTCKETCMDAPVQPTNTAPAPKMGEHCRGSRTTHANSFTVYQGGKINCHPIKTSEACDAMIPKIAANPSIAAVSWERGSVGCILYTLQEGAFEGDWPAECGIEGGGTEADGTFKAGNPVRDYYGVGPSTANKWCYAKPEHLTPMNCRSAETWTRAECVY